MDFAGRVRALVLMSSLVLGGCQQQKDDDAASAKPSKAAITVENAPKIVSRAVAAVTNVIASQDFAQFLVGGAPFPDLIYSYCSEGESTITSEFSGDRFQTQYVFDRCLVPDNHWVASGYHDGSFTIGGPIDPSSKSAIYALEYAGFRRTGLPLDGAGGFSGSLSIDGLVSATSRISARFEFLNENALRPEWILDAMIDHEGGSQIARFESLLWEGTLIIDGEGLVTLSTQDIAPFHPVITDDTSQIILDLTWINDYKIGVSLDLGGDGIIDGQWRQRIRERY